MDAGQTLTLLSRSEPSSSSRNNFLSSESRSANMCSEYKAGRRSVKKTGGETEKRGVIGFIEVSGEESE